MKITRKQLRKLINETIYVNPQGDAYINTQSDPTDPVVKKSHEREAKVQFLNRQGNEKLRRFAPDKLMKDIGPDDDPDINQGIELANLVGDQGEFSDYVTFTDDELELRNFARKEYEDGFEELISSDNFESDHTSLLGGERAQTDYSELFNQIEYQMKLKVEDYLSDNRDDPFFWDIIELCQEVPGHSKLMNIIAKKEGDFGPNMEYLKNLPEKVANSYGVYF